MNVFYDLIFREVFIFWGCPLRDVPRSIREPWGLLVEFQVLLGDEHLRAGSRWHRRRRLVLWVYHLRRRNCSSLGRKSRIQRWRPWRRSQSLFRPRGYRSPCRSCRNRNRLGWDLPGTALLSRSEHFQLVLRLRQLRPRR